MRKGQFKSSEDAIDAKCQHTSPCSDCPWTRKALNGWLGSLSADEWVRIAHSDSVVDCHTLRGAQCAGIAVYRRNVAKMAYPPNLKLEADRVNVFANPMQFVEHHSKVPGRK
jgi:hypothetical protein